jgi:hypothetical protein
MVADAAIHRATDFFFPGIEQHFTLARAAERIREERSAAAPGKAPFVLGEKDDDTAALAWFTGLQGDTFSVEHSPGHWQYHHWRPADGGASLFGRDAILVAPRIRRTFVERL